MRVGLVGLGGLVGLCLADLRDLPDMYVDQVQGIPLKKFYCLTIVPAPGYDFSFIISKVINRGLILFCYFPSYLELFLVFRNPSTCRKTFFNVRE